MTYKHQMEKAIKNYLATAGFKYYTPRYVYLRRVDDNTVFSIICGEFSYYRKEYYQLNIHAGLIYRGWNNLLYQLTEGSRDFDSFMNGPCLFATHPNWNDCVEFTGKRPMEENLDAFKQEVETRAFPILERYQDRGALYQDMIRNRNDYYYEKNKKWYMPIAHYVNGNHQEALRFVENVLKECEHNYAMNPNAPGYIKDLHDFRLYHKNLKRLIAGEELPPRESPSVLTEILAKLYKKGK